MQAEGVLDEETAPSPTAPSATTPSPTAMCAAAYAFLAKTPAPLVGVSLDDIAGETEPVNLPGVSQDRYASWTRRMSKDLDEIRTDPDAATILGTMHERRCRRREG